MRTRSSGTPKPAPVKKTPPSRKAAAKSTPNSSESATPNSTETKRTRGRPPKNIVTTPTTEPLESAEAKGLSDTEDVTPKASSSSRSTTRRATTRTKTPASSKAVSKRTPKSKAIVEEEIEDIPDNKETNELHVIDSLKEDLNVVENIVEPNKLGNIEETPVNKAEETTTGREELPRKDVETKGSVIQVGEPLLGACEFEKLEEAVDEESIKSLEVVREEKTAIDSNEFFVKDVGTIKDKSVDQDEESLVNVSDFENLEESVHEEKISSLGKEKLNGAEEQIEDAHKETGGNDKIETVKDMEESKMEPSNMEVNLKEVSVEEVNEEKNIFYLKVESKMLVEAVDKEVTAFFENQQPNSTVNQVHETHEEEPEVKVLEVLQEDLDGFQVEEAQEDLKSDMEKKILQIDEERKIESSYMEEDTNEEQVEEVQGKLKDMEKNILEITEERMIGSSYMEKDTDEEIVEEVQRELKEDMEKNIVEITEERMIGSSYMEKDTNEEQVEEAQRKLKEDMEKKIFEITEERIIESSYMEKDTNEVQAEEEEGKLKEDMEKEIMETSDMNKDNNVENNCAEENVIQEGSQADGLVKEPFVEAETLEHEHMELTAIAQEHKIRREYEIFVGGIDSDALEEDIRAIFETIGEVVEVRLHKSSSTNQNKGYAFVKFANKEHVTQALLEMKNPVIRGKRCGTAPIEDNTTLFLGNICNTWPKDAVKQKLKDYGIEGFETITLVQDPQHEGLSRGFAFIEFPCHADAMLAYKRLQKPDVIFGHLERTVRVAFAEPAREPNPDIMSQVKSVFIDGLPPQWDEGRVRNQFSCFGEIVRIMLARNMPASKRKDFGFVDFTTHEAALACIASVNNTELGDGNLKAKVRARLSNPSPKTQPVKGGVFGGLRIGHAGGGSFSKIGKGSERGGHAFSQVNTQRGRGFYQPGRNQTGRIGFVGDRDNRYPVLPSGQNFERGRRGFIRGSFQAASRGAAPAGPSRPFLDIHRPNASDISRGGHTLPIRQPFTPQVAFDRPFMGNQIREPYPYDVNMNGIKRPFPIIDHDPGYMEPRRSRPRLDYSDPALSFNGPHHHDTFGARSNFYPQYNYAPNNIGGGHPSGYWPPPPPHNNGYGPQHPHGVDYGAHRPHGGQYVAHPPHAGNYVAQRPHGGGYRADHPRGGGRPYNGGYN